jgi:hypothetical protein
MHQPGRGTRTSARRLPRSLPWAPCRDMHYTRACATARSKCFFTHYATHHYLDIASVHAFATLPFGLLLVEVVLAYSTYMHYTYLFLVAWAATRDEGMDPSSADVDHWVLLWIGLFFCLAFLRDCVFIYYILGLPNWLSALFCAAWVLWWLGSCVGERGGDGGFFCRYFDSVLR